jgi:hypothetical protein
MSSSGSVRLRYEICLEFWGNAKNKKITAPNADTTAVRIPPLCFVLSINCIVAIENFFMGAAGGDLDLNKSLPISIGQIKFLGYQLEKNTPKMPKTTLTSIGTFRTTRD